MSNAPTPHLDPSELGTKAYWDAAYTTELKNYQSSSNDEGTIWFDDAGAESRMIKYLESLAAQGVLVLGEEPGNSDRGFEEIDSDDPEYEEIMEEIHNPKPSRPPTSFLDLGTGNGHLLFELRTEDWNGRMVGVDYSAKSVKLASEIFEHKFHDICDFRSYNDVEFYEWDILNGEPPYPWISRYASGNKGEDFDVAA